MTDTTKRNEDTYKPYNMWSAQKMSHDVIISFAPSYCGKCKMSGSELSSYFCPKADPLKLARTLDEAFEALNTKDRERDEAVSEAVREERERIVDLINEQIIPECDLCGEIGYGKAYYGKGKATGDAWGDRYEPTGSVVFCENCSDECKIGKYYDGEEIWKRTSDSPEHAQIRLNYIKRRRTTGEILKALTTPQEGLQEKQHSKACCSGGAHFPLRCKCDCICEQQGLQEAPPTQGYCCENGNFGAQHECMKRDPLQDNK